MTWHKPDTSQALHWHGDAIGPATLAQDTAHAPTSVTAVPIPRSDPPGWPRRLLGGAIGAVVSVAIVLTLGVVALSPLGAQAAEIGVAAAFTCVVVSAALYGLLSRSLIPAGGPTSATALIVATLVARIVAAAPAGSADATLNQVVVALAASVALMGLLQLLMAAFHLGRLARVVPQPVLAGFMNGIALLILLSQLPALLAMTPAQWHSQGWQAFNAASAGALLLGLSTAALVWLLAWRAPRLPGALLALLAGVAVYHGAQALAPGTALGPTLGSVRATPMLPGLLNLFNGRELALATLLQHGPAILLTAALLAIIGTLESMLNLRATDQGHGTRHDEQRELWAIGLGNLVGGCLGALPMSQVRARAAAVLQAGGRGRAAALGAVAASALMITLGASWIAELPQAVPGRRDGDHRRVAGRPLVGGAVGPTAPGAAAAPGAQQPGHHGLCVPADGVARPCGRRGGGPGAVHSGLRARHEPVAGEIAPRRRVGAVAARLPDGAGTGAAVGASSNPDTGA